MPRRNPKRCRAAANKEQHRRHKSTRGQRALSKLVKYKHYAFEKEE